MVAVWDDVGMQGTAVTDRELLDAAAVCGHLLAAGSVHALLAQHRSVNGQWDLPSGGQQNCPAVANRTARWRTAELPTVQLVSGVTPFPAVAWVRRMLSPAVSTTWAWCMSRSTVALAMVLGMSSSKPAG